MSKRWMVGGVAGLALAGSVLATAPRVNASTASSAFTIGDVNAAIGAAVEFWGAHWSTANAVSGGPAPSSFKGFAVTVVQTPGQCSGTFTAVPADSSEPPATVPAAIIALVTNDVTKTGSVISGTFTDLATIQTNPGYGPDPGQPGTGTVTALCSQSGGGGTG